MLMEHVLLDDSQVATATRRTDMSEVRSGTELRWWAACSGVLQVCNSHMLTFIYTAGNCLMHWLVSQRPVSFPQQDDTPCIALWIKQQQQCKVSGMPLLLL